MTASPLAVLVELMVPHPGEQAAPFCVRVHVSPLPVASLVTVAANCCVALTTTLTEGTDRDTEMGGNVMPARSKAMPSATEFAWRNTPRNSVQEATVTSQGWVAGDVKCAGAVYVVGALPVVLMGETAPHAGLHGG